MPLRQTEYGGECPLGVWEVDVPAGGGCYTSDPLEGCLGNPELGVVVCNFLRLPKKGEKFDPAVQCQCPSDMTRKEYGELKKRYISLIKQNKAGKSKEEFWEVVRKQRSGLEV